jgi:hypothetical protein
MLLPFSRPFLRDYGCAQQEDGSPSLGIISVSWRPGTVVVSNELHTSRCRDLLLVSVCLPACMCSGGLTILYFILLVAVSGVMPSRSPIENGVLSFAVMQLLSTSCLFFALYPKQSPVYLAIRTMIASVVAFVRYVFWDPFPLSTLWRSWIATVLRYAAVFIVGRFGCPCIAMFARCWGRFPEGHGASLAHYPLADTAEDASSCAPSVLDRMLQRSTPSVSSCWHRSLSCIASPVPGCCLRYGQPAGTCFLRLAVFVCLREVALLSHGFSSSFSPSVTLLSQGTITAFSWAAFIAGAACLCVFSINMFALTILGFSSTSAGVYGVLLFSSLLFVFAVNLISFQVPRLGRPTPPTLPSVADPDQIVG